MHPYCTDSNERTKVLLKIGIISAVLAYLIGHMNMWVEWVSTIQAPSALGIAVLLFKITDQWLWRWRLLQKVGLFSTPDLNGLWKGTLRTSFTKFGEDSEIEVSLRIRQNWTKISITLETDRSISNSISANLIINQPERGVPLLTYEYLNRPRSDAPRSMQTHWGTAWLTLKDSGTLEGEYYTGRDRRTHGTLILKKQNAHRQPHHQLGV